MPASLDDLRSLRALIEQLRREIIVLEERLELEEQRAATTGFPAPRLTRLA